MEQFREDLDHIIDEAHSRGCEPLDVDEIASKRLANYVTAKWSLIADIAIKCFLVFSCTTIAGVIYALKAWATWTGHRTVDDQWLNWIVGVCLLSAASQFFPVERVIQSLKGGSK